MKNIVLNCHSDNINYSKTDVSSCLRYNLHSVIKITVFPCDLKRIHCICLVIITNRDNTLINISYDHLANSSVHSLTAHTHTSNDTHTYSQWDECILLQTGNKGHAALLSVYIWNIHMEKSQIVCLSKVNDFSEMRFWIWKAFHGLIIFFNGIVHHETFCNNK